MYMVSIGTECTPVTSNSTSVTTDYDYDPNSDKQQLAVDDYLNDSG